jgi:SAM domain (Sterile alpha motif)
MQEIADWLEKLGHRQYAQSSAENAIDLSVLPDQDLEKIGVLLGHRRKLLRAIAELDGAAVTAPPVPHVLPVTRAPLPAAAVATVPEATGERRYLTVMFCDLVGSTGSPHSSMPRNGAIWSAPILMPPRRRSPRWAAMWRRSSATG